MKSQWTEDLSVGVPEIDRQHQKIFERINALVAEVAMNDNISRETIRTLLSFLEHHTTTHLKDEESLMLKEGYPEYASHKREHDRFIKDVEKIKAEFETADVMFFVVRFQDFLVNWLISHESQQDKLIGDFLRRKR